MLQSNIKTNLALMKYVCEFRPYVACYKKFREIREIYNKSCNLEEFSVIIIKKFLC